MSSRVFLNLEDLTKDEILEYDSVSELGPDGTVYNMFRIDENGEKQADAKTILVNRHHIEELHFTDRI